jgi:hypothetical protein
MLLFTSLDFKLGLLSKFKLINDKAACGGGRVVRRREPHLFLDNGFTDGGEAVSLTRRPATLYA